RHGADHACRNSCGQRLGSLQTLRCMQRGVPKLRASRPKNWRAQGLDARGCLCGLNKRDDVLILPWRSWLLPSLSAWRSALLSAVTMFNGQYDFPSRMFFFKVTKSIRRFANG